MSSFLLDWDGDDWEGESVLTGLNTRVSLDKSSFKEQDSVIKARVRSTLPQGPFWQGAT